MREIYLFASMFFILIANDHLLILLSITILRSVSDVYRMGMISKQCLSQCQFVVIEHRISLN